MSNDPNRRKPKGPQPGNDDENRKARRIVMLIVAALIATHNPDLADQMDRKVALKDGRLEELDTLGLSGRIAFKQRFI